MNIDNLTLKEKISQTFITGFAGTEYGSNEYFTGLMKNGLGGVIFFSHNIQSAQGLKRTIRELNSQSKLRMFTCIDQEGGRVERTEAIHGGKKYLSARYAYEKGEEFLREQTRVMAEELNEYGINMNFAPVLDVNTNEKNPIIGERSYSSVAEEVIKASKIVTEEYEKKKIITVGKHFPGHGAASADSHKTMPVIDLPVDELEDVHIKPFKAGIESGLNAIMAAHVLYPALDDENPASVSKKILTGLLREKLGFKGVIITDDMEMEGIKGISRFEACKKAYNAGINMFIYRDTDKNIYELINDLTKAAQRGEISIEKINASVEKVIGLKTRYGII